MHGTVTRAIVATFLSISSLPSFAQSSDTPGDADTGDDLDVSASVTLISDYRFRGVSLSDRDFAVQGDLGLAYKGFHVGAWSSSIADLAGTKTSTSTVEVDYVAGYAFDAGGLALDAGVTLYTYPGSDGTSYWEPYVSAATVIGKSDIALLIAYVPSQQNSGDADNIYIALDGSLPLGDSGLSLDGHIGSEDGAFAARKWDWQAGLSVSFHGLDIGLAYIDTNRSGRLTKGALLISIGKSF